MWLSLCFACLLWASFWLGRQFPVEQTTTGPSFLQLARATDTDKVWGPEKLSACLRDKTQCFDPAKSDQIVNPQCRVAGHFYHSLYQRWLEPLVSERFTFLEIGFYNGRGMDAYKGFLPRAEMHAIELSCNANLWPGDNFAAKSSDYDKIIDAKRMHCGSAANYEFLDATWKRLQQGPPLRVVVDDASHESEHMAISLFYWFPKIEPGGLLILEDIEPLGPPHTFRVNLLPQLLQDVHYCGSPNFAEERCFPTIQPLLQSVHCDLHICVLERNDQPAVDNSLVQPPPHALQADAPCLKHRNN